MIRQICVIDNCSQLSRESDTEIPSEGTSICKITVDQKEVLKLLNNLKTRKASGPDGLSVRVLSECSSEIAAILS